jgi:hypothetical protein
MKSNNKYINTTDLECTTTGSMCGSFTGMGVGFGCCCRFDSSSTSSKSNALPFKRGHVRKHVVNKRQ